MINKKKLTFLIINMNGLQILKHEYLNMIKKYFYNKLN